MAIERSDVQELIPTSQEVEQELAEVFRDLPEGDLTEVYGHSITQFEPGGIVRGRIIDIVGDDVVVDVGYKSEGVIPLREFEDATEATVGNTVDVLLEAVEDESGVVVLSKRRADRIRSWQRVIGEHQLGDIVTGRATRKIKGGLLVDIGVPVFLPASQIGLRRPGDIGEFVGQELTCKILKIDKDRHNIVVSRRKLLEEVREEQKEQLFKELEVGQVRKGIVRNIADFGAFVDLGGMEGLLHITDMSWGRVSHPSEVVAVDEEVEVKILKINREEEKVSLGLKQKSPSPWQNVEQKYPVGSRVVGQVVNITHYGAFVKLEEGVEGLVHISEMSWTRRVNHPSELVAIGDMIDVVVLDINKEKEEISLGMKQTEANPWAMVEERYPPGTILEGRVRNLTNYGAFIEIEEGIDGLLHVSDMSWTKKVRHPSEVLKKGEKVKVKVLSVDPERKRVALGLKQLSQDPWEGDIPDRYLPGDVVTGVVTKTTSFGAFVELEDGLEGLLHISELAEHKVENPEEVVRPGQRVTVKVLRVDPSERKIGLSLKRVPVEDQVLYQEAAEAAGTALPEGGGVAPEAEPKPAGEQPEGEKPAEAPAPEPTEPEQPGESGSAEASPSSPPPTTA
jgi:small subunit ribosomal protein S1